jgi:hypothetical protein
MERRIASRNIEASGLSLASRFATDRINSRIRLAPKHLEARDATSR